MRILIVSFICTLIFFSTLTAQISKEEAIELAKKGDYRSAINILEQAVIENSDDAELYYYLGYFSHYLAYDSRPLIGYNTEFSDKVLDYLQKAIQLNPDYGDAYYFIGAEYGARALKLLQEEDYDAYISAYKKAYESKAFPVWLTEYGRNILKSCDDDAILFVGGDAEFNPIQYLQLIENFRNDVTTIPIAFLNRPWYVEKLQNGIDNILRNVPVSLSKEQIYDMHPYKWDTLTIEISISEELKKKFQLLSNEIMKWKLLPNLKSDSRTYIDAGTAVLENIIETNKWKRSIHFSLGCSQSALAGLDEYSQVNGSTRKLLPFKTEETKYRINPDKIVEVLMNEDNLNDFKDVEQHNMPRISNVLINYHFVLYKLALHYKEQNQPEKINEIISFIEKKLLADVLPNSQNLIKVIEKLLENE